MAPKYNHNFNSLKPQLFNLEQVVELLNGIKMNFVMTITIILIATGTVALVVTIANLTGTTIAMFVNVLNRQLP